MATRLQSQILDIRRKEQRSWCLAKPSTATWPISKISLRSIVGIRSLVTELCSLFSGAQTTMTRYNSKVLGTCHELNAGGGYWGTFWWTTLRPHACSSAVARLKRIVALVITQALTCLDFLDSLLIDFHVFRRAPFHCQHAAVAHDGSPWTAHCTHHLGRNSMQKAVLYHQCGHNSRRSREGQPQSRRPHSRHTI